MKNKKRASNMENAEVISSKNKWVAIILCFLLGGYGIHKFYLGKIGLGIIYLLTEGFFGIGVLVDLVILILGKAKDKKGAVLQ